MRLDAIVSALRAHDLLEQAPDAAPTLAAVTDDSRRVTVGSLFCAVTGTAQDGHRYLADAAARGAVAALVERPVPEVAVPQVVVRSGRSAASVAAATWYAHPAARLRVAAVTGTNGKTTTVAVTRHLLGALGPAGSVGTLGAFDGGGVALPGVGRLTTPGTVELQAVLAALRDRGVTHVAMEASSHALDQHRLDGVPVAAAVFTNLTHEHLDYHGSLEAYRAAKLRLVDLLAPEAVLVVNADDPAWRDMPRRAGARLLTFGRTAADVTARVLDADATGNRLSLSVDGREAETWAPYPGDFNVSNTLGAVAAAWGMGVDLDTVATRLPHAPPVPGRVERIGGDRVAVLRDYAHTPDALARVLAALRPLTTGRLIVLFGAGGDRDRTKRPLMGAAAAAGADLAVVTSDNPRTEDPEHILDEIEAGMGSTAHLRITDRREAIAHALSVLAEGDTLLLAGKGHETYQIVGTTYHDFDEREIVRQLLTRRGQP